MNSVELDMWREQRETKRQFEKAGYDDVLVEIEVRNDEW